MKANYVVKLSESRVAKKYGELLTEMQNHFTILIDNDQNYRTFRAIITRIQNERRNLNFDRKLEQREKLTGELAELINEASEVFEIDLYPAAQAGILTHRGLTTAIVRHEYLRHNKNGQKIAKIKEELSKKYNISVSAIEKIIYKR